ncbi:MAG: NAD(P)/FAD-dependent oxidoreductase [Chloroflexota bacterium]
MADNNNQVIIIGAGLAGLAAAHELDKKGISATVLEARQRVGGRVWSVQLSNGAWAELGGEWIHGDDMAMNQLATELDMELISAQVDFNQRQGVGPLGASVPEQSEMLKIAGRAVAAMDEDSIAKATLGDFIDSLSASAAQKATLKARFQGTFATDVSQVALRPVAGGFPTTDPQPAFYYRCVGGNQRLGETLANRLPDVRLGHVVKAVSYNEQGVTIRCEVSGESREITGTAVIVTVPFTVLSKIDFQPALPTALTTTLQGRLIGVAAKIAVATTSAPPIRGIQDVEVPYWFWSGIGENHQPRLAITAFAGSAQALDTLGTSSGDPGPWLARLRELNPDLTFTGEVHMLDWSTDPYACGSYSAFDNTSFDRTDILTKPVGRLVMAGEHTAGGYSGTMEGAVQSGTRAAEQVQSMLAK